MGESRGQTPHIRTDAGGSLARRRTPTVCLQGVADEDGNEMLVRTGAPPKLLVALRVSSHLGRQLGSFLQSQVPSCQGTRQWLGLRIDSEMSVVARGGVRDG